MKPWMVKLERVGEAIERATTPDGTLSSLIRISRFSLIYFFVVIAIQFVIWCADAMSGSDLAASLALAGSSGLFFCTLGALMAATRRQLRKQRRELCGESILCELQQARISDLEDQEARMAERVRLLRLDFEAEKMLLSEIREEREVELKALGFAQGVRQGPEIRQYLSDPRRRLRVVPDQGERSDVGHEDVQGKGIA